MGQGNTVHGTLLEVLFTITHMVRCCKFSCTFPTYISLAVALGKLDLPQFEQAHSCHFREEHREKSARRCGFDENEANMGAQNLDKNGDECI